ncbi:transglycosylase SLT domain-containing protein [Streptococcus vestibularis]|uniref:Transglycosylase-like domain protein n=1 Tax=Streptococcus vestibularis F0396 TaxID=904306 RepID=E3CSX1_STRVE|nr:transglycosylase SLT domain-containing protein [Streptococcus vestibularis]EFQ58554.1 Transglycosylase-like domain protein [Streptococcus vestibularis F0396]MBT3132923.1 transglycosylase SLT domain-containing protein [Streptococcus vestibularis]MCY7042885.1 transglycosylase SLT domain-containing protein [Streptococcus vestibularis]MDU3179306.1 transglycosylase SLT domain-containing protein [Streptococcus vestibularis]
MFKKSYKGRRIKLAAKKSLAVPVAIVTSFIVILGVSLSTLVNKGLVNAFSDSVTPAPSTASTTSESTADLVKSTEISSSKDNKANKEKVEESKPQSETTGEAVEAAEKSQSYTATKSTTTTSTDTTSTQNTITAPSVVASGSGSVVLSNGNTAGEIGSYAAAQMAAATGVSQSTWESIIARESNGDHTVANSSGASGLFQTMPGWGSTVTVEDQIQSALNAYNAQGLSAWNY